MSIGPKWTFYHGRYTKDTNRWKEILHWDSSRKCKSKPQWNIISHLSEWLLDKKSKQEHVLVRMSSKGEKSHAVSGNINWYGHYGK